MRLDDETGRVEDEINKLREQSLRLFRTVTMQNLVIGSQESSEATLHHTD